MFGKNKYIFVFFTIFIVLSGYSSTYEPLINTVYSKNKIFKVVICPLFCKEDSLLSDSYKLSYLDSTIDCNFRKQQITLYKLINNKYDKQNNYEVPIEKFFFSGGYNVELSNDGTKILFFYTDGLYGAIINLKDSLNVLEFYLFSEFNLSPYESGRLNEELNSQKGKSKIKLKLTNDKCIICLYYYNEKRKQYFNKRKILNLPS